MNGSAFETLDGSVETLTRAEPPELTMSLEWMMVVSWVLLTKVVARALPFQSTAEVGPKPVPLTVRKKPGPPAVALLGDSEVNVMEVLGPTGPLGRTEKGRGLDVPPPGPGVETVT